MASAIVITALGTWLFRGEARKGLASCKASESPELFKLEEEPAVFSRYAGSASCRECHEAAYQLWRKSNHGLAERLPHPQYEDAAFLPARAFEHATQRTEVRKEGEHYEVFTPGLGRSNGPFSVNRVIGNTPLRQFLVHFPGGRWQTLEASYDPRSNEWFNVYGEEDRKPGEWGHWTGRGMNWNSMCAACHNTRLRKNYDPASDTYHTTMAEMTVGCEACHGPMKDHVAWQKTFGDKMPDSTIKRLSREQMFDTCASCHSRRMELTGDFKPGENYYDHYLLSTVDETDTWYPDGQNRDENYEYTAFLGSRMYNKGVRCVDCHDFHSAKVRMPGNWMCLTCHAVGTTNAIEIDPVKHSFHSETNSGNLCVNCHMPQTAYMQRHWRHDHGFTIPDPELTKESGIPNACNRCHQDKSVDWSIDYVDKWYGQKMDRPYRKRARILARARNGDESARDPLISMLATNDYPYWRAVAARMLNLWSAQPTVTEALLRQLSDTNALVRVSVLRSLASVADAGNARVQAAVHRCLDDPVRGVRHQAASALRSEVKTNSLVGSELWHVLEHNSDQPVGQMQLGAFYLARGDTAAALNHYQKAVEWDAYSAPIRHELAVVLSMSGHASEAVEQLREACRLAPEVAEFRYKLALGLNEMGDLRGTLAALNKAVELDPNHARAWYNLGLARNATGDIPGAIEALVRAEALSPDDPRIAYARATILLRRGDHAGAQEAARRALSLNPNYGEAAALLRALESGQ